MPTFERGDVVRVPFPYTDRPVRQQRPALVVSAGGIGPEENLLWVVMITSADNRAWPGDVDMTSLTEAGLPSASVVRPAKVATIEARHAGRLGRLSVQELAKVNRQIDRALGRTDEAAGSAP